MTGTFDNWSKSEKMEKVGDKFEKSVDLPDSSDKIYYKVGTILSCQLPASIRFFLHSSIVFIHSTHALPLCGTLLLHPPTYMHTSTSRDKHWVIQGIWWITDMPVCPV